MPPQLHPGPQTAKLTLQQRTPPRRNGALAVTPRQHPKAAGVSSRSRSEELGSCDFLEAKKINNQQSRSTGCDPWRLGVPSYSTHVRGRATPPLVTPGSCKMFQDKWTTSPPSPSRCLSLNPPGHQSYFHTLEQAVRGAKRPRRTPAPALGQRCFRPHGTWFCWMWWRRVN